jgi:hypothetical protein
MSSLYDELAEKVKREPRVSKPTVARFDLTLLLFNAGDSLRELWAAAEAETQRGPASRARPVAASGSRRGEVAADLWGAGRAVSAY